MIQAQVKIASSPVHVRNVFLDFEKIPEWHNSFVKSISRVPPDKTIIENGDKLNCKMGGMAFVATVAESSDSELKWQRPPVYGLLAGLHSFRFEPSEMTPRSTTFIQTEEFSGLLAFVMSPGFPGGKKIMAWFEGFNEDLKARAEKLNAS